MAGKENFGRKLIDAVPLANGLTIYFYDCSRHIAADRWYVCLTTEIPIPIKHDYFFDEENPDMAYREFINIFGKPYVFSQKKERNFIDERDVSHLLASLKKDFISYNLPYVQLNQFPMLCIKKAYREWKEKQKWKILHEQAVQAVNSQ